MVSKQTDSFREKDDGDEELAIRFVNTAAWRLRDPSEERLMDAQALLGWLGANGIGPARELKRIRSAWQTDVTRGATVYREAIMLREAIYDIFVARIKRHAPPGEALKTFNRMLMRPISAAALVWDGGSAGWGLQAQGDDLDILKPIIISAAALMTGPRARRVKQCQDDRGCGWLFVDESRAQNRRWCAMGDCGNRAKAHRHYQRIQGKDGS
ncbi:ABATE domain-containing protein [Bradyrhizobium sp. BR 10289]|uniref:CGNR zinc finger domain-containing protein n=1 Tax=Bradyrhizobium sp. BR 10289 TaxID=2749993 RepID=UPI001E5A61CD|nr:ABATE domain-containing protein [Bradyrhizobium sp. BR 10289]